MKRKERAEKQSDTKGQRVRTGTQKARRGGGRTKKKNTVARRKAA